MGRAAGVENSLGRERGGSHLGVRDRGVGDFGSKGERPLVPIIHQLAKEINSIPDPKDIRCRFVPPHRELDLKRLSECQ